MSGLRNYLTIKIYIEEIYVINAWPIVFISHSIAKIDSNKDYCYYWHVAVIKTSFTVKQIEFL